MAVQRVAVVTGANRGIGFEMCRQLAEQGVEVVLTARSVAKGREACRTLVRKGLPVQFHPLDVTKEASIVRMGIFANTTLGRVDILVNNAGIYPERPTGASRADLRMARGILETNLLGAWRLCQELLPLMKRHRYGRIVNISSGSGSFAEGLHPDHPGYAVSKAAKNALTAMLADELRGTNILVNAACPGWVRTDMGGPAAPRSVAKGAETPVWLALLSNGGPSGQFFRDRRPIPW